MTKTQEIRFGQYFSWVFLLFHGVVFLGINTLLIISNLLTTPEQPWFIIPLSFWGMVLVAHLVLHFVIISQQSSLARTAHGQNDKTAVVKFFFWMAFYCHVCLFMLSSVLLCIVNYLVTPKELWALIVIVSWGLWIGGHFALTFLAFSDRLNSWRQAKIANFTRERTERAGRLRFMFWVVLQVHYILYFPTMIFLAILDLLFAQGQHWILYPFFGWGTILFAHWLMTRLLLSRRVELA